MEYSYDQNTIRFGKIENDVSFDLKSAQTALK